MYVSCHNLQKSCLGVLKCKQSVRNINKTSDVCETCIERIIKASTTLQHDIDEIPTNDFYLKEPAIFFYYFVVQYKYNNEKHHKCVFLTLDCKIKNLKNWFSKNICSSFFCYIEDNFFSKTPKYSKTIYTNLFHVINGERRPINFSLLNNFIYVYDKISKRDLYLTEQELKILKKKTSISIKTRKFKEKQKDDFFLIHKKFGNTQYIVEKIKYFPFPTILKDKNAYSQNEMYILWEADVDNFLENLTFFENVTSIQSYSNFIWRLYCKFDQFFNPDKIKDVTLIKTKYQNGNLIFDENILEKLNNVVLNSLLITSIGCENLTFIEKILNVENTNHYLTFEAYDYKKIFLPFYAYSKIIGSSKIISFFENFSIQEEKSLTYLLYNKLYYPRHNHLATSIYDSAICQTECQFKIEKNLDYILDSEEEFELNNIARLRHGYTNQLENEFSRMYNKPNLPECLKSTEDYDSCDSCYSLDYHKLAFHEFNITPQNKRYKIVKVDQCKRVLKLNNPIVYDFSYRTAKMMEVEEFLKHVNEIKNKMTEISDKRKYSKKCLRKMLNSDQTNLSIWKYFFKYPETINLFFKNNSFKSNRLVSFKL